MTHNHLPFGKALRPNLKLIYNQKTLMSKAAVLLSLTFVISTFAGCSASPDSNAATANVNAVSPQDANKANTNVEELGVLVNVPYESDEASWKEDKTHKKVIAVLRFPEGEAKRLVDDASKIAPPITVTLTTESWFPSELTAQSETNGEGNLTGEAYPANAFYMDPYNNGRITRVEGTDYFVLELSAK
jgi:hypothetical protein